MYGNTDQIVSQGIVPPKPHLANALPEIYPEPHDIPQGWGLTFFLHLRDSAVHSEGTGWWAGLANLFYWIDRKRVRRPDHCHPQYLGETDMAVYRALEA